MKKEKKYSDLYVHLVFIIAIIACFYTYFDMGKIVGFIVGIIILLFEILLIYTSISNIKNKRNKKSLQKSNNYFENYDNLKQTLNNYNPKNKFGFIVKSNEENSNITQKYINEFQNRYNVKLPEILKEYYLKYNKSDIKECEFYLYGEEYNFCIEFLYSLKNGTQPVEKFLDKWIPENEYISNSWLPLACDADNSDYYWDKETGKVFYLSLGNVENPIPICDSVEEFFKLLNYVVENAKEKN